MSSLRRLILQTPIAKSFVVLAVIILTSACHKAPTRPSEAPSPTPVQLALPSPTPSGPVKALPVEFVDVTESAGIAFRHHNGSTGKKFFPERFGSGCAFLDFDNDGWLDIFLVNSGDLAGTKKPRPASMALYRNNQNGSFTDVTTAAGLDQPIYGIGVTTADFDNDGWTDIFVTGLGQSRLYRNTGDGKFSDVTAKMKLAVSAAFPTTAIFFDYDKDGRLDLFVNNYVNWTPDKEAICGVEGGGKTYCTAESFPETTPRLYRNLGPFFVDVTGLAALDDAPRRSPGALAVDYDRDGWLDLFVVNEGGPNALYHNNGRGQFTETALTAGLATDESPRIVRSRGIDAADFDRSGLPSFFIARAEGGVAFFHNKGRAGGLFANESAESVITKSTQRTSSTGVLSFDYDLDGWQDVLVLNGGLAPQALQLFHNEGKKAFADVSRTLGKAFQRPMAARGGAYGDYDRDGDLDLLISTNGGPAFLLRNEHGNQNHFVRFLPTGTQSNRSAIGTRIAVFLPDGTRLVNWVRPEAGYCSRSEPGITFGLSQVDRVARVEIEWPSGKMETLENLAVDQVYTLKEGSGISR